MNIRDLEGAELDSHNLNITDLEDAEPDTSPTFLDKTQKMMRENPGKSVGYTAGLISSPAGPAISSAIAGGAAYAGQVAHKNIYPEEHSLFEESPGEIAEEVGTNQLKGSLLGAATRIPGIINKLPSLPRSPQKFKYPDITTGSNEVKQSILKRIAEKGSEYAGNVAGGLAGLSLPFPLSKIGAIGGWNIGGKYAKEVGKAISNSDWSKFGKYAGVVKNAANKDKETLTTTVYMLTHLPDFKAEFNSND